MKSVLWSFENVPTRLLGQNRRTWKLFQKMWRDMLFLVFSWRSTWRSYNLASKHYLYAGVDRVDKFCSRKILNDFWELARPSLSITTTVGRSQVPWCEPPVGHLWMGCPRMQEWSPNDERGSCRRLWGVSEVTTSSLVGFIPFQPFQTPEMECTSLLWRWWGLVWRLFRGNFQKVKEKLN